MSRDDIREALWLLEEPAEASVEFRKSLQQRFLAEATGETVIVAPERRARLRLRRPRLSLRLAAVVGGGLVVALLGTFVLLIPRAPSAWATFQQARDRFEPRPLHARISNSTQAFDADLNTVMEIRVVEIWFENESRWREQTRSYNLAAGEAGSFVVTDGERFGTYSAQENTFNVRAASEVGDLYTMSSPAMHDPTAGAWATQGGIKPTRQFLDENCSVDEDRIAGREADRLHCRTGLEGDTIREVNVWLDRETGFILRLETFACGTVERERRCGREANREVTAIEFDPSFPSGLFDVTAPEGATVIEEAARPDPGGVSVDVDPARIEAGLDAIWVSGGTSTDRAEFRQGPGRLQRIDPGHHSVVATIDEVVTFALGEKVVWIVSSEGGELSLRRLDPDTNRYTGTHISLGDIEPQDVSVGEGTVWVVGARGEEAQRRAHLLRIDPATSELRSVELDHVPGSVAAPEYAPSSLSVGDGAVWVNVSHQPADVGKEPTNEIQKVDAETLEIKGTVRPSRRVASRFGEGALWTLTRGGGPSTLTKIDPVSLGEAGKIDLPPDPQSLSTGFGVVWILSAEARTITKVDAKGLRVLGEPIVYGSQAGQSFAIIDGNRTAWVGMWTGPGRGTLVRIDVRGPGR